MTRAAAALCCLMALASGASAQPAADGGQAQPLASSHRLETSKVKLGEPFTYEVVVEHDKGERYELTPGQDLGSFELLEQQRSRKDEATAATTTFRFRLSAFELGTLSIPNLRFEVFSEQGARSWSSTGPEVTVVPLLPPDAEQQGVELNDIRPPEEVGIPSFRLLYLLAGALAVAALAYALYRYLKRPRAPRPVVTRVLPLETRTRSALDALKAERLAEQGRQREFYFRLSEILRGHLGERYGFDALESTSPELLARVKALHAREIPLDELQRFTARADLAKFAKQPVALDECEDSLAFAYRLLEATRPTPTPPAAPPRPDADAHQPS